MALCKALCAFREPFKDGVVEALHPGAMVHVPNGLVLKLADDGHIEMPAGWMPERPAPMEPPSDEVEARKPAPVKAEAKPVNPAPKPAPVGRK